MFFVAQGNRENIPRDTPPPVAQLIGRCWDARSEKRPAMTECVEEIENQINEMPLNTM